MGYANVTEPVPEKDPLRLEKEQLRQLDEKHFEELFNFLKSIENSKISAGKIGLLEGHRIYATISRTVNKYIDDPLLVDSDNKPTYTELTEEQQKNLQNIIENGIKLDTTDKDTLRKLNENYANRELEYYLTTRKVNLQDIIEKQLSSKSKLENLKQKYLNEREKIEKVVYKSPDIKNPDYAMPPVKRTPYQEPVVIGSMPNRLRQNIAIHGEYIDVSGINTKFEKPPMPDNSKYINKKGNNKEKKGSFLNKIRRLKNKFSKKISSKDSVKIIDDDTVMIYSKINGQYYPEFIPANELDKSEYTTDEQKAKMLDLYLVYTERNSGGYKSIFDPPLYLYKPSYDELKIKGRVIAKRMNGKGPMIPIRTKNTSKLLSPTEMLNSIHNEEYKKKYGQEHPLVTKYEEANSEGNIIKKINKNGELIREYRYTNNEVILLEYKNGRLIRKNIFDNTGKLKDSKLMF